MALKVGVISAAHVHAPSFVSCFLAEESSEVVGVWDDNGERGSAFAEARGLSFFEDQASLLSQVDAVVICSENLKHGDHVEAAAKAGVHILCEKPIAATQAIANQIRSAVKGSDKVFMTAFPCPFSPTFSRMQKLIQGGEIGHVLALCTTNRGMCPFGWFTEPGLSGGGAMVDHVVHVGDLLRRLLGEDPISVYAQVGSGMYGGEWEDTAKLTLGFPSGVFATLDSSWSRPTGYKIWGDVTLKAIGEKGVLEADLFGQGVDKFASGHGIVGTGSNLDRAMVREFLNAVHENRAPLCTLEDGIKASMIAEAGYRSLKEGKAVAPAA